MNELKPAYYRVPQPRNPNHTKSFFSCNDTVADSEENRNAEPLYTALQIATLRAEIEAKQARIDALMLEYCPDEMTGEQMENWAIHQRAVTEGDGWIEWRGGEKGYDMPVSGFTRVQIKTRKYGFNVPQNTGRAYSFRWDHYPQDSPLHAHDIIAYRVAN